ncbi:M60 family metallopeptidase [Bombilactobacillus folatiphilus]|uniref:M60 family metallopeptidase n=1 Tax=Bombilactobacillus folatiphilus TaxID=2923362 RepID=A0ABY4PB93_9LACO|nr:putative mucin/carbohydrate-binding domain-containing protein [Bombilactobacillus folatiphilus]UQS82824.1 M60 family metallopeptidase [Bombilactobacillus folatiphilus]
MHLTKKSLWFWLGLVTFMLFSYSSVQAQDIKTQNITSLPEPTWISNSGMSKGKYHDRQDLGFILRENKVLKVRQVNPDFKGKLTLRLLGFDSKMEKSLNVTSQWQTVSADSPLVPFIDTPYGNTSAKIEYEVEDTHKEKPLPIYQEYGNQTAFFKTWDDYDANFALIKGKDFQLLIPKSDKEKVRHLQDYKNLDELIEHYNELFAFYNKMAGFDGSTPLNLNGQNRYFLKADAHGDGGAYYSDQWAANTAKTADMWLKKNDWATLHEIAHGYQAGFDGVGMYTGEVSNNLFGVQYQYTKYGKKADQIGWLFNYGKKDAVENGLYKDLITNHGTYSSVDLREKLILLTMIKQKAGDASFTKMYQEYRQLANQPGFNKNNYPLPDLMNQVYSENSHQDFTPVLQKWGLSLNNNQAAKNRAANYPAVASLADVIPKSQLPRAHALLDDKIMINSNFEMVQDQDIVPMDLHGNLTLKLNADDLKQLAGTKVSLKDGAQVVATQTINGDTVNFKNIANGVYTLDFAGKQMDNYLPDQNYVYVKEANNTANVKLTKINNSSLTNQELDLLGLSDVKFATLKTNLNNRQAVLDVLKSSPHNRYVGETYAKITVKDSDNKVKFNRTILGTNNQTGTTKIPLAVGDTIEVYHAETRTRLRSSDNIIDKTKTTNQWTVTKWGLQNKTLKNDPQQDLIKKITQQSSQLQNDPADTPAKKNLLVAIDSLNEPYKTQYSKQAFN